ncbi:MAG: site-specific DNA-methyltransferase [Gemmatimonadota bacterium]|nr:site-specific DNA-methyltransferase [Gemmatimonadota bacterium]
MLENRVLYCKDNLSVLRRLPSSSVQLIATDPPFNKGKVFESKGASFSDKWSAIEDYDLPGQVGKVIDIATGSMSGYLSFLTPRLLEMRRVLREDGSIYLHIDWTAHAYVKILMDAIFGASNFRNEIIWSYTGPSVSRRFYPRKHDTILFYTKTDKYVFNADDIRVPYKRPPGDGLGFARRGMLVGGRVNRLTNAELAEYLKRGKMPESYWLDFSHNMHMARERTGYPTQKPCGLYRRMVKASSEVDQFVLDPFCGSGTTLVAAEQLCRRWMGIDELDAAIKIAQTRLPKAKIAP